MFRRSLLSLSLLALGLTACGDPGSATDPDAGPTPDAAAIDATSLQEIGSWDDPIVIRELPFQHAADTTEAPADLADAYSPCAPTTDESGREYVYRLELAETLTVDIAVNDVPGDGVDIDVHLLSAPDPQSCDARDNISLRQTLDAGTYWIVADTWVNGSGEAQAGPYELTVAEASGGGGECLTSPISCTDTDLPLVNGVPVEPPGLDGCPDGMLGVEGFCIDRYEASLALVENDGSRSPWSPYAHPGQLRVIALSAPGMVPQGYITQLQAGDACAENGKRLCTDAEWLRACQGSTGTTFPYGDSRQPGVCNDARTCHPVIQYFETTEGWIWSALDHPCINQLPDGLATTGEHAQCQTEDGLFDMMGNLHEWTADPTGTFRGGFYVDTEINGPGCLYRTTAHNVQHWDYSTGFRCCADRP